MNKFFIDLIASNPDATVPVGVYIIELLIIALASVHRREYFRDSALKMGSGMCLIAIGLLAIAGINKGSKFNTVMFVNLQITAFIFFAVVFFYLYLVSTFCFEFLQRPFPSGGTIWDKVKWLGMFGISIGSGFYTIANAWHFP